MRPNVATKREFTRGFKGLYVECINSFPFTKDSLKWKGATSRRGFQTSFPKEHLSVQSDQNKINLVGTV